MTVRDKFLAVRDELNNVLLERTSAIDNALLALVSGEHFLQLGPPGTAKSLLVRELCKRIQGAEYFEKLMSAFTTSEEVFGPIDLVKYAEQGQYVRISTGSLSQAHIAFLDEVYKANSAILNSLLAIINERLLHEVGQSPQRVPLLSLFAASNETPQDSSLRALDDRFLLRQCVEYISEETSFAALIAGKLDASNVTATITLDDITTAQQQALTVKGNAEILQALLALRQQFSEQGILVSDRRWRQIGKLLKAQAWINGHSTIELEDLTCLVHACWTDPREQKTVQRIVYEIACPLNLRALEIQDQAQEVYSKLPKVDALDYNAMAENCLVQITDMHNALKYEIVNSNANDTSKAVQSLSKIASLHKAVSSQLFKSVSRMTLAV